MNEAIPIVRNKWQTLSLHRSHHAAAKLLAAQMRRTLTAEVELLIEEECKRQGVDLPAEAEGGKSL